MRWAVVVRQAADVAKRRQFHSMSVLQRRLLAEDRSAALLPGSCCLRSFSSLPDHTVVGMPALSPTMTHGNMGKWEKQPGDEIAAGDVVCEVETDKATVDFDAQDDSFMAKHLVESGAQDIPVGTPIFVTVDDASAVDAFKDFTADAAAPPPPEAAETETEKVESPPPSPPPAAAPPAPKAEPVAAPPAAAAKPVPVAAPAVAPGAAQGAAVHKVFKRDWGSGVKGSPLAHRMSAEQKKYVEKFGSTLQTPLEP